MIEFKKSLIEQNQKRIDEQERIYNYYIGNKNAILEYLQEVQKITFDTDTIVDFQKVFINITKKVINKLANVYKEPAERYFIDSEGEYSEDLTNYYNNVLPLNINSIDKQALRYAKAFNTSLTYCGFSNGKMVYKVLPSFLFNVVTQDDHSKIKELSYPKYLTNRNGEPQLYVVTWTDTEHYMQEISNISNYSVRGNKTPIGSNIKMINPYGKIPYAVLRLEEQNDFWGNGQTDLVNINEQINFLLSDLINSGVIMQSWGTPVAINCGLSYKSEKGTTQFKKVRIGAKHPLIVENASSDMVSPSFEYKNANPMIAEIKDTIDWMIKMIAATKGLNPNSFLSEVKAVSGFSKIVDSLEEMELRQDDIEPCRIYEDERYEITKKVLETHKTEFEYKEIKDFFVCDFAEIEQTVSTDEDIKKKEFELKNNLITPLDLLRERNPDLSDDELKVRYEENLAINKDLKPDISDSKDNLDINKDKNNG